MGTQCSSHLHKSTARVWIGYILPWESFLRPNEFLTPVAPECGVRTFDSRFVRTCLSRGWEEQNVEGVCPELPLLWSCGSNSTEVFMLELSCPVCSSGDYVCSQDIPCLSQGSGKVSFIASFTTALSIIGGPEVSIRDTLCLLDTKLKSVTEWWAQKAQCFLTALWMLLLCLLRALCWRGTPGC
jgi:hypothetical protein